MASALCASGVLACFCSLWARSRYQAKRQIASSERRLVVITGCDVGIGRALVKHLLKNTSFHVVAVCLTQEGVSQLHDNKRCTAVQANVTSDTEVNNIKAVVLELIEKGRAETLHCVVNNAGIVMPGNVLWHQSIDRYQQVMDVNFYGQVRVAISLVPLLLNVKGARLINMSSVCGTCTLPGNSSYSASKWAVEAWSDTLRIELKPFGVQVVKARPGMFATQMQPTYHSRYNECFRDASLDCQAMYGGDKFLEQVNAKVEQYTSPGEGVSVCVAKIAEIILLERPSPSYFIGSCGFFKALANLPVSWTDSLKAGFPGVSPLGIEQVHSGA